MTINNKSERNYRGKCLGSPVTSYGGEDSFDHVKDDMVCVDRETLKKDTLTYDKEPFTLQ